MPPKAKFTEEQIINTGLEIVRQEGMDYLTARALGKRLGSSACPIFTIFENMEEVQEKVKEAAKEIYGQYIKTGLEEKLAFKGVGMQYILFAIKEPKLFQLLFMTEQKTTMNNVLQIIEEHYQEILDSVQKEYHLSIENSKRLYRHLWIYTHGIASLCATHTCTFTGEEIGNMMTEVCRGVLKEIRSSNND